MPVYGPKRERSASVAETGKASLLILDSLIDFFLADEDENAAVRDARCSTAAGP